MEKNDITRIREKFVYVEDIIHGDRTADIAVAIATKEGFCDNDLLRVRRLASLHDIGKSSITPGVLNKKKVLNADEWIEIKKHPVYSEMILWNAGFREEDCKVVRWHHEKIDGSGYPDGLRGSKIPHISHIITIADIFDALTHSRVYRKRIYSAEEAIDIMIKDKGLEKRIVTILADLLETIVVSSDIVIGAVGALRF